MGRRRDLTPEEVAALRRLLSAANAKKRPVQHRRDHDACGDLAIDVLAAPVIVGAAALEAPYRMLDCAFGWLCDD